MPGVKQRTMFKCEDCKKVAEIVYPGGPVPVCCGKPMTELVPKTGEYTEKHVPFIEKKADGVLVKVGRDAAHPMTAEHQIAFIEICADGMLMRKYLKPGEAPEAFFKTDAKNITAMEYCNLHGLWKSG